MLVDESPLRRALVLMPVPRTRVRVRRRDASLYGSGSGPAQVTKTTRYHASDPHAGAALLTSNWNSPDASFVGGGRVNPLARVHARSLSMSAWLRPPRTRFSVTFSSRQATKSAFRKAFPLRNGGSSTGIVQPSGVACGSGTFTP